MNGFLLSPGITPILTDVSVTIYLLGIGVGAIVGGRRGFVLALAAVGTLVCAIKLYTDWPDLRDDLVALVALIAVLYWTLSTERRVTIGRRSRGLLYFAAILAILTGLYKAGGDFFDPFDLLVAFTALLAGIGVVVELYRSGRAGPGPEGTGANSRAGPE